MSIPVHVEIQPDSSAPTVSFDAASIHAFLYDISEYGLGLISNKSIPWGVVLDMKFQRSSLPLPRPTAGTISIIGRVVHSIPRTGDGQYQVGISFTRMSDEDRSLIRQIHAPAAAVQNEQRRVPRITVMSA